MTYKYLYRNINNIIQNTTPTPSSTHSESTTKNYPLFIYDFYLFYNQNIVNYTNT